MASTSDRYSHGHHESVLRSHRWRTAENSAGYLLAHLGPGQSILDVGCGPGNITADFARLIKDGSVTGIDVAAEIVEAARGSNPPPTGVALSFEVGDVYALAFEDDSFDVVHAHQVLQHLSDPVGALEEMKRVLAPGGLLAVRDGDYGAFTWWPDDARLTRWLEIYHQLTARNGAQANAGRQLKSWVRAAGFEDFEVTASSWVFESPAERAWWGELWAERIRASAFHDQCLEYELCESAELAAMAEAFERWSRDADGVFVVPSVEVLARK